MTVIAANHRVLVGDSQVTDDGIITLATKVEKIKGDLVGCCGSLSDGVKFREWYKDKENDSPSLDSDFAALVVTKEGDLLYYDNTLVPLPCNTKFYAIGSGQHIAMGAMMAGATPYDAARIACTSHNECCGPVHVLTISP